MIPAFSFAGLRVGVNQMESNPAARIGPEQELTVTWSGPYAFPGFERDWLPPLPNHGGVYLQTFAVGTSSSFTRRAKRAISASGLAHCGRSARRVQRPRRGTGASRGSIRSLARLGLVAQEGAVEGPTAAPMRVAASFSPH